jgi:hypothetical protein
VGLPAALAVMDGTLSRSAGSVVIADIAWERVAELSHGQPSTLFNEIDELRRVDPAMDASLAKHTLRSLLVNSTGDQRQDILLNLVKAHAAAVLGLGEPTDIREDVKFLEMGFSSFTALELRNRLSADIELDLPAMLAIDYPDPVAMVTFLGSLLPEEH